MIAGAAGAALKLPPVVDIANGAAVGTAMSNLPSVELNFNPGDKIIMTNTATTIRSTSSSEGDNGIQYTTSIIAVSSKGVQTQIYQGSTFVALDPITYDSHNTAMKAQENSQNSKTVVTNPNFNGMNIKLVRTN